MTSKIQPFGFGLVRRLGTPRVGVLLMGAMLLFSNFAGAAPSENTPPFVFGPSSGEWVVVPGITATEIILVTDREDPSDALLVAVTATPVDGVTILDPADVVIRGTGELRELSVTTKPGVFGSAIVEVQVTDTQRATSVRRIRIDSSWFRTESLGEMRSGLLLDLNHDDRRDIFEGPYSVFRLRDAAARFLSASCDLLGGYDMGSVAADLNGDGWMDIAAIHLEVFKQPTLRVLLNTGDWGDLAAGSLECGLSTAVSGLPVGWDTRVVAVDYDNDGDLDLMVGGAGNDTASHDIPTPVVLWQNDGSGARFTPVANPFPTLASPNFAWADYNKDGIQDVLLTGVANNQGPVSRLFRGDSQGGFQEDPQPFVGIWNGGAAWGDFDNDDDLDLVMVGRNHSGFGTDYDAGLYLYRNDQGTFRQVLMPQTAAVVSATPRWIDVDSDGDLDLVIGGSKFTTIPAGETYLLVQESTGNFKFMGPVAKGGAAGLYADDWDSDGDADLVTMSVPDVTMETHVLWLRNLLNITNPPPEPPTNLRLQVEDDTVVFAWDAAHDANQSGGLSYNLRVGSAPGKDDLVVSMSDPTTGRRRLPASGNVGLGRSWRWRRPVPGPVYWSVQAIDHGLAASTFAPEQQAEIGPFRAQIDGETRVGATGSSAYFTADITTFGQPTVLWMEWGATEAFGRMSPPQLIPASHRAQAWVGTLFDLPFGTALRARLVVSNQFGVSRGTVFSFTTPAAATYGRLPWKPSMTGPAVMAWADFDEDGDMDLAVAPRSERGVTGLFRGDGRGWFSEEILATNGPVASSVQWVDADGDGDLDMLVGEDSTAIPDRIFLNSGGHLNFSESMSTSSPRLASPVWADFDQDGDPDPIMRMAVLYRNLGRGHYATVASLPAQFSTDRLAWANVGAPGLWDYVTTGNDAARVYRARSPGVWELPPLLLPGLGNANSLTRDFTGDWLPDALLGLGSGRRPQLYANEGRTNFVPVDAYFDGVTGALVGHADINGDGRPDVVTTQNNNLLFWVRSANSYVPADSVPLGYAPTNSGIVFADVDNDGGLDLAVANDQSVDPLDLGLYRNTLTSTVVVPAAPTQLTSEVASNRVILRWATPENAAAKGLPTFNVEIGTTPGRRDVVNGWANRQTGYRRVPKAGNAGYHREFVIRDLFPGTYYWTVQSVNEAYLGSSFASEVTFEVGRGASPRLELSRGIAFRDVKVQTSGSGWLLMEHSADLNRWTSFATNYLEAGREFEIEVPKGSATSMLLRGRLEAR